MAQTWILSATTPEFTNDDANRAGANPVAGGPIARANPAAAGPHPLCQSRSQRPRCTCCRTSLFRSNPKHSFLVVGRIPGASIGADA
jgi:hypothetical protein